MEEKKRNISETENIELNEEPEYKFRVKNLSKTVKSTKLKIYFEELGIKIKELTKMGGYKTAVVIFEVKN